MTTSNTIKFLKSRRMASATLFCALSATIFVCVHLARAGGAVTPLNISQVPLTITQPVHPQVLIALGNSESMDGNLAGAIMTGSGALASGVASLKNSSSPQNYVVPAGFTPPKQAAVAGSAPYTVASNGKLFDNGDSRMNVAKAGIQAIIQSYMVNTDFALETYQTSNVGVYDTWVYYMSNSSGFAFSSTNTGGGVYVANPCLAYSAAATSTVKNNCSDIAGSGLYTASSVSTSPYIKIGKSSDDPDINDVLYVPTGSGSPGVYVDYGTIDPATPFPPNRTLAQYNQGQIQVSYSNITTAGGAQQTGPTNAGFVPYSKQVLYSQRGFGYAASQTANAGQTIVPMTSSGKAPTAATVSTAVSAFTPYLAPETNDANTGEIKSSGGQAPVAGLLATAKTYLSSIQVSGTPCPPRQYVVLISDGLPTQDLSGQAWPPLGSAAAASTSYNVTASFNTDGSLQSTNDQALTDAINNLKALNAAGIQTFVIGLGAGVDATKNPQAAATLTAMAVAGGSTSFFPAKNPTELVNDLKSILVSVQANTLSTSAAAVNSTQLQSGSVSYQSNFTTSDKAFQDWTGDVFQYALDTTSGLPLVPANSPVGTQPTPIWSAGGLLDTLVSAGGWSSKRLVATWNDATKSGQPFEWLNISPAQQTSLQPSDLLGQGRLEFLRGNSALEKRNGGTFRNRSHVLGDIVDSQPLYVGAPAGPYTTSSYVAFESAKITRKPMLYIGANDGMLHAFDATTGVEQFSFIPNGVFANLISLTDPYYNLQHKYFVDGSPQSGDVKFADGTWHTLLASGENAGGKSIFALDITDPATLTTEVKVGNAVLWEYADTDTSGVPTGDLGLTYSEPQVAQVNASPGFAVFFGNGYNSTNNSSVLYALDPQKGTVITKIDLCAKVASICDTSKNNGLSTVSVGYRDGLIGGPISQVYAGDLQGNLWAVDVSNTDATKWAVRVIFQAVDAGGNRQPITTAPVVSLHPNYPQLFGEFVMVGTGQLLTAGDLSAVSAQSLYGIWDKPGAVAAATRASLVTQTLTFTTITTPKTLDVITATSKTIDWSINRGWLVDLPNAGQRVVTAPLLINGTFISTLNTPVAAVGGCSVTFKSNLLELNYATGGSFDQPLIDTNGDGQITSTDQKNVVGISLGNFSSSAPIFITSPPPAGTTGAAGTASTTGSIVHIQTTQSSGNFTSTDNLKPAPILINWWQIL